MSDSLTPKHNGPLDLRQTKCPLNFVHARLALEKLPPGHILEIWLQSNGDSAINVPESLLREGHQLLESSPLPDNILLLRFQKRQD